MNSSPRIAVVLTSFNHAPYLRECIESVLNQTYRDFELIIWDDGSTDESWDIIQGYRDDRIRAVRNDSGKSGWGFRKAVRQVRGGDFIAIQHSDDAWEAAKLEEQLACMEAHPEYAAVFTRVKLIDAAGQPFGAAAQGYADVFRQPNRSRHEWLRYFFLQGNALCHPSVLMRRTCFETAGGYRLGFAQLGDLDTWVRICLRYEIHILPEELTRFRILSEGRNASSNTPEASVRTAFELLNVYANYREVHSALELKEIFPAAAKYLGEEPVDLGFALGMAIFEMQPDAPPARLMGLRLVFEALNDRGRAERINTRFGFDHSDFVALTAREDVFAIQLRGMAWLQPRLETALQEERQARLRIEEQLRDANAELEGARGRDKLWAEFQQSRAWKTAAWLRGIRARLAPPGSLPARLAGAALRLFGSLHGSRSNKTE